MRASSVRRKFQTGASLLIASMTLLVVHGSGPVPAHAEPEVVSGYGRGIHFSGYDWSTKIASVLVGPGPNYFRDAEDSAWVDDQDRLHLRVHPDESGAWAAAEVVLQATLGYGTYTFVVDGPLEAVDPNVVLGLFTWNDDPTQSHRELDIEFARWGDPQAPNGQYTVQPFQIDGHESWFATLPGARRTTHVLRWRPDRVAFTSADERDVFAAHVFTDGVPAPGGEQVRINLWLDGGRPPIDGMPAEVIIESFSFQPFAAS
jgi:hypothetical protein